MRSRLVRKKTSKGDVRWLVKYREGTSDRTKSFTTKRDAELFQAQLTIEDSVLPRPDVSYTLRQAFERMLVSKESQGRRLSTLSVYRTSFNHLKELETYPLESITVSVINRHIDRLKARGVSQNLLNKIQMLLSQIFDLAIAEEQFAQSNPVLRTAKIKAPAPKKRPIGMDLETVKRLALEIPENQRAAFWMAAGIGLRRGEIEALKTSDFGKDFATVHVARTKRDRYEREAKTKSSIRTLTIPEFIRDELRKVVPTEDGRMFKGFNNKWADKHLKPALVRLGIEPFGMHGLRDVAAGILMVEGGIDAIRTSQVLGHSTPNTTMTRYAGHREKAAEDAAAKIEELYKD